MALEGTLSYLEIADLLKVIGLSRKSGVLEISWEDRHARLFLDRGALVCAQSNRFHEGIGTLLVQASLLSEDALEKALMLQKAQGGVRRLGAILCDEFEVRPEDVETVLHQQFQHIAFDVFSWPGGSFVFQITEPSQVMERFRLDPVEFILGVGIQAGLLAEKGVERARESLAGPGPVFPVK